MQSLICNTMFRSLAASARRLSVATGATTGSATGAKSRAATVLIPHREKHSSTQIKRLFKQNPARQRVLERLNMIPAPRDPPTARFAPIVESVEILPNGWTPPAPADLTLPEYPFAVARTKNKPMDAVGFLPVYSRMRKDGTLTTTRIKKVTGDQEAFIQELRATLGIPVPKHKHDDMIRVRMGGTIEVKGNHVRQVRTWLAGLGF